MSNSLPKNIYRLTAQEKEMLGDFRSLSFEQRQMFVAILKRQSDRSEDEMASLLALIEAAERAQS